MSDSELDLCIHCQRPADNGLASDGPPYCAACRACGMPAKNAVLDSTLAALEQMLDVMERLIGRCGGMYDETVKLAKSLQAAGNAAAVEVETVRIELMKAVNKAEGRQ